MRPERTSDDFPLPDVPTTARKRVDRSLRSSASISLSRPKNRWSSSGSNGRRPGNGLNRGTCLQLSDKRGEPFGGDAVPLRNDNRLVRAKPLLLGGARTDETDADHWLWLRAAVPGCLLHLSQLPPHPQ